MHRTYSMRQSRAPTQAQMLNPPPPPSSTKSGRLFGRNNFGHAFRKTTAGAFGPDLAKRLSQLVKMEKNVMRSMELVGRERREVARQLSVWGEECDEDVSDVSDKLGVLIFEIGELEDQFIDKYDQYRVTMKSIRNIEASVQPSRDRKQKITDQIAQLKYKDPTSPKISVLENELVRAEAESLVAEAQLSNITREKIKAAFNYQFDALQEHCEKVAMIAGYGKHLLQLIDDTPVTPGETRAAYDGYEASKSIIQDCENALVNWIPARAAVKSRLSVRSRSRNARRLARARGEGISLTHQDRPMKTGSGVWVPAEEHERKQRARHHQVTDDEEYEDIDDEDEIYGQHDGDRRVLKTSNGATHGPSDSTGQTARGNYARESERPDDGDRGGRFYSHAPTVAAGATNIPSSTSNVIGEDRDRDRERKRQRERGRELDEGHTKELGVPVEALDFQDTGGGGASRFYRGRPELAESSSYERLPHESIPGTEARKSAIDDPGLIEKETSRMERPELKAGADPSGYAEEGYREPHSQHDGPLKNMGRKLGVVV